MNSITVSLLLFLFRFVLSQRPCYFPDGNEAPDTYRPCRSNTTSFNTCCYEAHSCLENGLCSSSTGRATAHDFTVRGACTDEDWSGCPSICPSQESKVSIRVKQCDDGKYCCHTVKDYDCCVEEDFRFSLEEESRKPVAAIAGGTVGGVVGVAILVGLGWLFWKRKKAARVTAENSVVDETSSKGSQVPYPTIAEADAGPDSVLIESDARPTHPTKFHELAA